MGGGKNAGNAPRFKGKIMLGHTCAIVELLDPSDSQCFRTRMRNRGLRDLTPPSGGKTFRSKRPTEDWMKQVANLDPDWWYISGHFARTPHYEALAKAKQQEKTIIPLFPKKTERWGVTIKTINLMKQGGLSSYRVPETSFGLRVETTREIELLVENNKLSCKGETSIVSVEPYTEPKGRYSYKPIKINLAGNGTIAEQAQWEWKTSRAPDGTLRFTRFLMSKSKEFLENLSKLESHETPFCFPETYPLEVKKIGSSFFTNENNQPESIDELNLIFRSKETIDESIGYCVSSRWEIGKSIWEEPSAQIDSKNLNWDNPRDRAQAIAFLQGGTSLFQSLYERVIFSNVRIMLKDSWTNQYDYPINECRQVGSREEGLRRCSERDRWSRFHPRSTDEIKVRLIERQVDKSQDASFFNKLYYDNEYQSKQQPNSDSWRIRMEYGYSRDELKTDNFFEEHGPGSYSNAKVVVLMSCNTLALASVRKYYSQLFPKAIFLGHIHKNPVNATPIIRHFIDEYFSDPAKAVAYDWQHVASSWLSYHDNAKNSIMKRGYGLAAMHQGNLYGIKVDNTYDLSTPLAKDGETIQRLRLKAIKPPSGCKPECQVDALLVWDSKGQIITHKAMYKGEGKINDFRSMGTDPYKDTNVFPLLTSVNLFRNRGY